MTFLVIVLFIGLLWINYIANHIPKTGRDGEAKGEIITAVITNSVKTADKSATMRLEHGGRKFKVKMKPDEAHLWIKGDSVRIILSENKKTYRVLFGEYFRENEARIRERALELLLKKVKLNFISARFTKYTKESFEAIKESNLESQRIFTFVSLMRILDIYTVFTAAASLAVLFWCIKGNLSFGKMIAPILFIVLLIWILYNTNETCKSIIKKAEEKNN